ncbi:MAG: RNA-directed DNA polymerase [Caldilineaceae bacterium]
MRKVHDPALRWLIDQILASGVGVLGEAYDMVYVGDDDLFTVEALRARPRGLPIGNLTSQFWANCYLNPIDHFIKRELGCAGYVRYVDDLLLFADDKATLWRWKTTLTERLATLRLTFHPGAQPRPVAEGFPFLGFILFPERRRLKRRKGLYFQRKFTALLADYRAGRCTFAELNTSVQGWVNHVRFANTVGLRKAILRVTPRQGSTGA